MLDVLPDTFDSFSLADTFLVGEEPELVISSTIPSAEAITVNIVHSPDTSDYDMSLIPRPTTADDLPIAATSLAVDAPTSDTFSVTETDSESISPRSRGHHVSRCYYIRFLAYNRRADSWSLSHTASHRCCSGLCFCFYLHVRHTSQRVRLKTGLRVKAPTPSGV
jgi:hypothetical protein